MKTTFANDLHDYMVRFTRHVDSNVPSLPLELVCNIMSYLDCLDLLQCQLVCKIFRKLILETSRLSYIIDLYKYRMVSIISSSSPLQSSTYNSRLALLRERERNWRMLGWKTRCTVDLPPTGSLYEFVGGVYANGREGENRITSSISFLELPSTGMVVEKEKEAVMVHGLTQWTHLMPDYNIIDFTMDPVQDLLVLVVVAPPDSQHVYDLHIRSIKTNQPHPRAPKSVFPCLPKPNNQPHPFDVVTAVRVQVCGHLVALLIKEVFDNSGGYLEIWNWTFGPTQSCRMPRAHGIDDFTFLTKEVCLVVRPTGRFEVYDFWDPKERSSEPVLRYAYAFPPLSNGYTYWYISLSSNPTPGWVPQDTHGAQQQQQQNPTMEGFLKGHQQIHYPSPEERVHACCLYVFNPADPVLHAVSSFVFFIKIESLLNPSWHWFSAWEYEDDVDDDDEEDEDAGNVDEQEESYATDEEDGFDQPSGRTSKSRQKKKKKAHKAPYYNPVALERRRKEEGLPVMQPPRFHEGTDEDDDDAPAVFMADPDDYYRDLHMKQQEQDDESPMTTRAESPPPIDIPVHASSSSSSSAPFVPGPLAHPLPLHMNPNTYDQVPEDFFDSIPTFTPVGSWGATHPASSSTSQVSGPSQDEAYDSMDEDEDHDFDSRPIPSGSSTIANPSHSPVHSSPGTERGSPVGVPSPRTPMRGSPTPTPPPSSAILQGPQDGFDFGPIATTGEGVSSHAIPDEDEDEEPNTPSSYHASHASTLNPQASTSNPSTSTHNNPSASTSTSASASTSHTSTPAPSQNPDPATCEPIPWTAWGPQNTRWFEECLSTDWQHAIYGMRAVESVEVSRLSQERQFRIHEWPVGGGTGASTSANGVGGSSMGGAGAGDNAASAHGIGTGGSSLSFGQGGNITPPSSGGFVSVAIQTQDTPQAAWDPLQVQGEGSGQHSDQTLPSFSSPSSSSSALPTPPPPPPPPQHQPQTPLDEGPKREKRFLRVRDFSPYALTRAARLETKDHPAVKGKGKCRTVWRTPKIIKDASRVYTKGVFKEDIMSSLPYVETVTDETFDVTDVMMDDCRLLLLKRGPAGRINQMEVLMM